MSTAVGAPRPTRLLLAGLLLLAVGVGGTAAVHPWAPVVSAAALLALAAAWQQPLVAAVVVVAVCPALSGLQRGLGVPLLKVSEVLLLLAVAALLARRPRSGQRLTTAERALLAFAVLGAAFGLLHVLTGTSSPPTLLRVGLQPTLLLLTFWAASRATVDASALRVVLRWALAVSTVPAALTLLQVADAPGVRSLLIRLTGGPSLAAAGEPGVVRATGPFPLWHSLAAYLLPVLVVGVVLLLRRRWDVLGRAPLLAVLALDAAALAASLTITVVVWAGVAVLVAAALQRRAAAAAALLAAAALAGAVLFAEPIAARVEAQTRPSTSSSSVPQTLSYRAQVWQRDYLPLLERAAPYGVGNELPPSVLFQHTENQYLALLLRGGVLLVLAAAAALAVVGAALARAARARDALPGMVAAAALGALVFLPVASLLWPYLTNAGFPQAWLALSGAALGAAAGGRRGRRA